MYYYLTSPLKRRLILELQNSFARHPVYSKIVPYIQNRFSFSERPPHGIVVQSSGSNKVALSGDNFMGMVHSYVMLAYYGQPVFPLEWVREDSTRIRNNEGRLSTVAGVYFLEILQAPTNPEEEGFFAIDPLLTVFDEPVLQFQSGVEKEAQLQYVPVEGTLRLWENYRAPLYEGSDFEIDGRGLRFLRIFNQGTRITADYRRAGESLGPISFRWNTADFKTLPGVVLAFGKRAATGDKVAVVVTPDRTDTAKAFGGKFETNFDLTVIARDSLQMEEIGDLAAMYLWSERKSELEFEGIELLDVNLGGESEELYDETAQLFYYQTSLTVSLRADWEVHVPLPFTISRVTPEQPGGANGLQSRSDSIFFSTHPVLVSRGPDYERLG